MHVKSCCFARPIAFLPFSLFSPSSLLKLFIVVILNFCYHGNVSHPVLSIRPIYYFFCRFRCRRRLALLSVSVIHGPFNLGKVLNFTSRLEKSESLDSVQVLKKYLMSLLGLEKSLKSQPCGHFPFSVKLLTLFSRGELGSSSVYKNLSNSRVK